MIKLGHVPLSFGMSYTVPLPKTNGNVHGKSAILLMIFGEFQLAHCYQNSWNTVLLCAMRGCLKPVIISLVLRNLLVVLKPFMLSGV